MARDVSERATVLAGQILWNASTPRWRVEELIQSALDAHAREERERCAKVVELVGCVRSELAALRLSRDCAAAIRARTAKETTSKEGQ